MGDGHEDILLNADETPWAWLRGLGNGICTWHDIKEGPFVLLAFGGVYNSHSCVIFIARTSKLIYIYKGPVARNGSVLPETRKVL
jgi:hypothetical protein